MRSLPLSLAGLALFWATQAFATDWPHLRGPALDGRATAPGTFAAEGNGFALAWKAPIGSGYSGIAVAGGRAVTMFTEGDADWIAAFDAATGKRIWSQRLGPATRGH